MPELPTTDFTPNLWAPYLRATSFLDFDHPAVAAFVQAHSLDASASDIDRAVSLYYAVRDGYRYSPWNVASTPAGFAASVVVARDEADGAHCVDKAVLLAACCRAIGIASRLHFANVRNHVGTAELERQLGTDLLVYHGYCELYLEGRWVAATPAFNRALCERLGVAPLDFDGRHDSVFQAYDRQAGRFMEYVDDHGCHADVPYEAMVAAWKRHYPKFAAMGAWPRPGAAPLPGA